MEQTVILGNIITMDEKRPFAKAYLLAWQDFALKNGYTAVCDAGAEVIWRDSPQAYYELEQEGKLKMRTPVGRTKTIWTSQAIMALSASMTTTRWCN